MGEDLTAPSCCATDNKGAADLSYNPEHHRRSKHVERRHFYIRDMVEALELSVPLVRTDEDLADMLRKVLAPREFFRWRAMIMNEPKSFFTPVGTSLPSASTMGARHNARVVRWSVSRKDGTGVTVPRCSQHRGVRP